jgi:hypothetical protein
MIGLDLPPAPVLEGAVVWDRSVDVAGPGGKAGPAHRRHAAHQRLLRAYQARYIVLPDKGPVLEAFRRHYDPDALAALAEERLELERALIAPAAQAAIAACAGADALAYAEALIPELRAEPEPPFMAFLRGCDERAHHYRDFLIQSSADLLAEASASALGVIGEFGPPQSALFRILIDEFGYGVPERKHAYLYRLAMRGFGLDERYNAYSPLFDTAALELHNAIHYLFQNPRNFFLQVGFLLFAETAYQRSTQANFRYLREFHPDVDARYFGEHGHIDLHHTRMVLDDVVVPLIASYGAEVGGEIVAGAEFTRQAFARAGDHRLAVSKAFAAAEAAGQARHAAPRDPAAGVGVTPDAAGLAGPGPIRVGGLGLITDPSAFAAFPDGAFGRLLDPEAAR